MTKLMIFVVLAQAALAIDPPSPDFGPIGGAEGQVLRLNVAGEPGSMCIAELGFHDLMGNVVGPAGRTSGVGRQVTSLDVGFATIGRGTGQQELVPAVRVLQGSGPCHASAEVYDAITLRTMGWYPTDQFPTDQHPGAADPPSEFPTDQRPTATMPTDQRDPVGAASGQTVRLSIVGRQQTAPGLRSMPACTGQIGIAAADGSVRVSKVVSLMAGQGTFLDAPMSWGMAVTRQEFSPYADLAALDAWIIAVEVFDTASAWTQVLAH